MSGNSQFWTNVLVNMIYWIMGMFCGFYIGRSGRRADQEEMPAKSVANDPESWP